MESKDAISTMKIAKIAYVAFRADYRYRWSDPEAEPTFAWNFSSEKDRWIDIARAMLEDFEVCYTRN